MSRKRLSHEQQMERDTDRWAKACRECTNRQQYQAVWQLALNYYNCKIPEHVFKLLVAWGESFPEESDKL